MAELPILASQIVARLASGDLKGCTPAEIRTLLALTNAGVKAAYEANADTNAFTNTLISKLNNIEALADVTDPANVAAAGALMDSDFSAAEGFMKKNSAGVYTLIKSNLTATTDPGSNNDNTQGYGVGSKWINVTLDKVFEAVDVSTGAAVWKELSQDGGAMVLLGTETASASATVDFTSIPSTYKSLLVKIHGLIPATDDTEVILQFDYGSGFITSGYDNASQTWDFAGNSVNENNTAAHIPLLDGAAGWGCGNAANELFNAEILIYNANDSGNYTPIDYRIKYRNTGLRHGFGIGEQTTNGLISGLRFQMSSGNITSGEFKLYGIL